LHLTLHPTVLLVMGLAAQLVNWPLGFLQALVQRDLHVASGDRTPLLRALDVPAIVLHGLADTLVDPSGGRATAAAIPGAELVLIEGMGHDLPRGLWERIADHISAVVRRGEARARLAGGGPTVDVLPAP
jgi:pimeloyl-ACP methyl ester carboxylesterase